LFQYIRTLVIRIENDDKKPHERLDYFTLEVFQQVTSYGTCFLTPHHKHKLDSNENSCESSLSQGFALDTHVVLSSSKAVGAHDLSVQPFEDGRMRYIQPMFMAEY
jgi:hypothetical protein